MFKKVADAFVEKHKLDAKAVRSPLVPQCRVWGVPTCRVTVNGRSASCSKALCWMPTRRLLHKVCEGRVRAIRWRRAGRAVSPLCRAARNETACGAAAGIVDGDEVTAAMQQLGGCAFHA